MTEKYALVTSNEKKLNEFNRFGLDLTIKKGLDLPEVLSDDEVEVICHKSKLAGEGTIVEDTTVMLHGKPMMDIKFRLDELKQHDGEDIVWTTLLAKNTGRHIYIYRGVVVGRLEIPEIMPEKYFGFDPVFVPEYPKKASYTLAVLEEKGLKDAFSARKYAAENYKNEQRFLKIRLEDIGDWDGAYQQ